MSNSRKLFRRVLRLSVAAVLALLPAADWVGMVSTASAQVFRLDSIRYNAFAGLVQLGWQSQPGEVYSVHSSPNLTLWDELKSGGSEPLRIIAAGGNRTQLELAVPLGERAFWRLRKRPIISLGTLIPSAIGGPVLRDVNDSSRVVGYFQGRNGIPFGFTWAPGEELFSFGETTVAVAVNRGGTVVGYNSFTDKFFSWTKTSGMVERGSGAAVDINESGHILGYERGVGGNAFLWKSGTGKIRIPHLSSTEPYTVPEALSDAGHVVGVSLIDGNYYRAFLWTESGGLVDLTGALSSAASGAIDVNSSGQVVGHRGIAGGSSRAFSWTAATGFVTFPEGCYITDLSENGKVVGRGYLVGNRAHAFSWTQSGGIVDLGDGQPERVNELGQIVGSRLTGAASPILWSPDGGQTGLEGLSSQNTHASLINNNGVIFGSSLPLNSAASHLVMWTTNPNP